MKLVKRGERKQREQAEPPDTAAPELRLRRGTIQRPPAAKAGA